MKLSVLIWLGLAVACAAGPPCQIGMVVRAGALNYDAKILSFNPATGLKTCEAPEMAPVPVPWFVGVWHLTTGGSGAWAKNPSTGSWKVVGLDAAGAPPIRISADGSYYLVFVANAGGGAALVSWATADNFPGYLTDFTGLAEGLQLKR